MLFLKKYFDECNDYNRKEFIAGMNETSKQILKKLKGFTWTLHPTGKDYKPGNERGCCGVDVITTHGESSLDGINSEGKHMAGKSEHLKVSLKKKNNLNPGENKQLGNCAFKRDHKILNKNFKVEISNKKIRRNAGLKVASEIDFNK